MNKVPNEEKVNAGCIPVMSNKLKLKIFRFGKIYIKSKVYGYTTITKCGHPYRAEKLYTQLYLRYKGPYKDSFKRICGKGASNRASYRVVCSRTEWFGGEMPESKAGSFATRVDGLEFSADVGK